MGYIIEYEKRAGEKRTSWKLLTVAAMLVFSIWTVLFWDQGRNILLSCLFPELENAELAVEAFLSDAEAGKPMKEALEEMFFVLLDGCVE